MISHPIKEVNKNALEYFNGDSLSADVWIKKYSLKDSNDNYYELSPIDMHRRLAREFARIEARYPNGLSEDFIFDLLDRFKYIIPQGSPMSGIGNNFQTVSISNCFVVGNKYDSYGGILNTDQEQIQLMKRRGGVGHDLSHIRPKGSPVKNSALTSTGVVPFMERFSNSTREVAQDGRRGALMLTISMKHPDAEDFIDAKLESGKVTGANISVKIDDEFMKAVKNDDYYLQCYPINTYPDHIESLDSLQEKVLYSNQLESKNKYFKKVKARDIWNKIVNNAWKSAEPGILFWDTIERESPAGSYGEKWKETATNPCGEIPLNPYDSCRLLAINLFSYVEKPFTKDAFFNFDLFKQHVRFAQRLSDDIVDLELEKIDAILEKIKLDPEPDDIKEIELNLWNKIKDTAIKGRRTGTGITAEGDMLAALGLTYGSDDAIKFSEEVHRIKALSAYRESVELAKERGAFPEFKTHLDINSEFIKRLIKEDIELKKDMAKYGRRNISLLTIAPTGTTSMMTQTTSGIEPVFLPVYKRRRKINPQEKNVKIDFVDEVGDSWTEYNIFHHNFLVWAEINGYSKEELEKMEDFELTEIIAKSPYYRATSNDVDWVQKVKLQGTIQKWVDHSISVTVNLPNNISVEKVGEIYATAHEVGCKGITIYRDGSRSGVLISSNDKKEDTNKKDRPQTLPCDIHHAQANKRKYYVIVGLRDDKPYEIFAFSKKHIQIPQLRKEGKLIKVDSGVYNLKYNGTMIEDIAQHFESPEEDGFTRMVSLLLRRGISVADVVDQLDKSYSNISSFYKVIARTLRKNYITDEDIANEKCPNCGSKLKMVEGCKSCASECGWSKCS